MFNIFWSFLAALWPTPSTDEGCHADPHGGCGTGN
jgi:hypothetical protein